MRSAQDLLAEKALCIAALGAGRLVVCIEALLRDGSSMVAEQASVEDRALKRGESTLSISFVEPVRLRQ